MLRPFERAVLRRQAEGLEVDEIADRFRVGSDHIERVLRYAEIEGRTGATAELRDGLRPLERRVLRWRKQGRSYEDIGAMFKRSPEHIQRIEGLAYLSKSRHLLSG